MLDFLFKKKDNISENKADRLNSVYAKLKEKYNPEKIPDERKNFLKDKINLYGYLNYPFYMALDELKPEEILFGLEIKWQQNNIFKDGKFIFNDN